MYLIKNSKSPYWQIQYLADGKYSTKSTKTKIKSEALKFLSEFDKHIKKQPEISPIKLSKYKTEYINYLSGTHSQNYLRNIKLTFTQFLLFTGDKKLNAIDTKTIDQFFSNTYSRAPQSALAYYRILKAAFNKAIHWNYIEVNPIKKIRAPKVRSSFPAFFSAAELQLIIIATKEQYLKDLFFFAFHTGMRLSEITHLKWQSVNLRERIINVEHSGIFTLKSKRERIIPINTQLYKVLSKLYDTNGIHKKSGYVFWRIMGVKLAEDFVSKKFKRAVRIAKLDQRIHFHSLRTSFASNLVQAGCSLYAVKELLGHQDYKTTLIYSRLQNSDLSKAVEFLSNNSIKENETIVNTECNIYRIA